jgi:hypothetical protein
MPMPWSRWTTLSPSRSSVHSGVAAARAAPGADGRGIRVRPKSSSHESSAVRSAGTWNPCERRPTPTSIAFSPESPASASSVCTRRLSPSVSQ